MYALDFEYDGQYLSDYGFIICTFDNISGTSLVEVGSKITFNKVARHSGKKHSLSSTSYSECIQSTFSICKNPDVYDDLQITNDESRDLIRWLNRNEFLKFRVLNDDSRDACYYNGSFNVKKITIRDILYGLELTMETDMPYGYGEEQVITHPFENANDTYQFYDFSDEIGGIYPLLTITCYKSGDLTIHNDFEDCTVSIKNCEIGEIITIDGDTGIITTSRKTHDICNDYNYEYLKIGNTIDNRVNKITVSLPCEIEFRYSPIIKDSP